MSFEALRSTNIDEDLLQENELEDADANSDIVIDVCKKLLHITFFLGG